MCAMNSNLHRLCVLVFSLLAVGLCWADNVCTIPNVQAGPGQVVPVPITVDRLVKVYDVELKMRDAHVPDGPPAKVLTGCLGKVAFLGLDSAFIDPGGGRTSEAGAPAGGVTSKGPLLLAVWLISVDRLAKPGTVYPLQAHYSFGVQGRSTPVSGFARSKLTVTPGPAWPNRPSLTFRTSHLRLRPGGRGVVRVTADAGLAGLSMVQFYIACEPPSRLPALRLNAPRVLDHLIDQVVGGNGQGAGGGVRLGPYSWAASFSTSGSFRRGSGIVLSMEVAVPRDAPIGARYPVQVAAAAGSAAKMPPIRVISGSVTVTAKAPAAPGRKLPKRH